MIIQKADGSLTDAQTGAKWTIIPYHLAGENARGVVILGPPLGREGLLHSGSEDECRAFLAALAADLDAVRWDASSRTFVPVGKENG